jgi:hypothetical protein
MEFVKRSAPERSVLELLVCAGLSDAPKASRLVLKLLGEQKASGAFPNQFDPAIGGVATTISSASLLLDCKLPPGSHPIAGAVGYLLDKQRDDGGWCESKRVKIPEWMTCHSNKASVSHYTAMALRLLDRVGLRHHSSFKKAETWPRSMQEPDGEFRYHLGAMWTPTRRRASCSPCAICSAKTMPFSDGAGRATKSIYRLLPRMRAAAADISKASPKTMTSTI